MKAISLLKNISNGVYKKTAKLFDNKFAKTGFSWWQVRVIKNLPMLKFQSIELFGHAFHFYHRDEMLHSLDEIFIEETYKQTLPSSPYIIDCGANIGLSVLYLKRLFPDATIVAFEPDETNFSLLKKNTESFGLKDVQLRKEAVWVDDTVLTFSGNSSQMSHIEKKPGSRGIQVQAIRLKNMLNRKVDFLKIDIEGAEYDVMKDIADSLSNVHHLFVEYHGTFSQNKELNEILDIITRNGYSYYLKHAIDKHPTPFIPSYTADYDVQLNIFCFRK